MDIPEPVVFPPAEWPPRVMWRGHVFQFKPLTTAALLKTLAYQQWDDIIPRALESESVMFLLEKMADKTEQFDVPQLKRLATKTVEMVTGTTWNASCMLAASIVGNWFQFTGLAAMHGFQHRTAHISEMLAFVYQLSVANQEQMEVTKINMRLWPLKDTHSIQKEQAIMAEAMKAMKIDADGVPIG